MADDSLTPTQTAEIDADPAGDMVLVIGSGDGQRSIRASSKVLSLASPVLAAMFGPHRFLEGTALSSSNPPEIYLPEDDPEVVTMFCRLVHFQQDHAQHPTPSVDELMKIALFCDKYDAGLALNPWSELWLQSQSGFNTSENQGKILALAYAFDNQAAFWRISRSVMLHDDTGERSDGDELRSLLPQDVYASIAQDRKSGLLDLSSSVERIMARFFQDGAGTSPPNAHIIKAGYFFQELYRLEIWPISTRGESIDLKYIQRAIVRYNEQDNTSFKDKLVAAIADAVDAQDGLCLSCVRKGRISSQQGNCHALLRFYCTG